MPSDRGVPRLGGLLLPGLQDPLATQCRRLLALARLLGSVTERLATQCRRLLALARLLGSVTERLLSRRPYLEIF